MFFPISMAFYSGADDEHVEVEFGFTGSCTGVRAGYRSIVPGWRQCWWRASSRVHRWLWVMRQPGEWIELNLPVT